MISDVLLIVTASASLNIKNSLILIFVYVL